MIFFSYRLIHPELLVSQRGLLVPVVTRSTEPRQLSRRMHHVQERLSFGMSFPTPVIISYAPYYSYTIVITTNSLFYSPFIIYQWECVKVLKCVCNFFVFLYSTWFLEFYLNLLLLIQLLSNNFSLRFKLFILSDKLYFPHLK